MPNRPSLKQITKTMRSDSERWAPQIHDGSVDLTVFYGLGLAGEAGEAVDEIKKGMRRGTRADGSLKIDDAKFAFELADTFTYLLLLADEIGLDLTAAWMAKREMNEERFGTK